MIIGIEDKSNQNFAFSVDSIILLKADPDSTEHCLLYLAHINGVPARIHFSPDEFMKQIGAVLDQVQGRAALLGMARGGASKQ
jgi:hypothetical protein